MKNDKSHPVDDGQRRKTSFAFRAVSILLLLTMASSALIWLFVEAFSSKSKNQVAIVGNASISVNQFRDFLDAFSFFNGFKYKSYDNEESGKDLLKKEALSAIIFDKMVDQEMKSVGFVVPDDLLISWVKIKIEKGEIPFIRDINQFRMLLNTNQKLAYYVIESQRRMLFLSLNFGAVLNDYQGLTPEILTMFAKSRNEKRILDLFTMNGYSNPNKGHEEPTRDELLLLYKQQQENFIRKSGLKVRMFTSEDFASEVTPEVTKLEAIQYYKSVSGDGSHRRDVSILYAKSKESAQKALFIIKQKGSMINGKDFSGEEFEIKEIKGIKRGDLDPSISSIVFSSLIKKPTPILELGDGNFIIVVTDKIITDVPRQMSEDEEKKIKTILSKKKFCEIVGDRLEKFKSMAIKGFDLKSIASEIGGKLKIVDIPESEELSDVLGEDFVNAARKAKSSLPDFIKTKGGPCHFVFFEVIEKFDNSVIPFSEAKETVLQIWRKNRLNELTKKNMDSFVARIRFYIGGSKQEAIYDVARAVGAEIKKGVVVTRGFDEGYQKLFSKSFFDQIFMSSKNSIIGPEMRGEGVHMVGLLRDIKVATDKEINESLGLLLIDFSMQYKNDFDSFYKKFLESKYRVVVGDGYHEIT